MLKHLITSLTNRWLKAAPSEGYKTIVYPSLGQTMLIHDSLDFGPIASTEELTQYTELWDEDEMPTLQTEAIEWHHAEITFESPCCDINPSSGLPMLDSVLDVSGNVFGMSSFDNDFGTDFL